MFTTYLKKVPCEVCGERITKAGMREHKYSFIHRRATMSEEEIDMEMAERKKQEDERIRVSMLSQEDWNLERSMRKERINRSKERARIRRKERDHREYKALQEKLVIAKQLVKDLEEKSGETQCICGLWMKTPSIENHMLTDRHRNRVRKREELDLKVKRLKASIPYTFEDEENIYTSCDEYLSSDDEIEYIWD